jgi:hypothetical protein
MSKNDSNFMDKWLRKLPFIFSYLGITGWALFYYSKRAFHFIRFQSSSITTDVSLKMGFYFGLILFTFGFALLFDKFFNYNRWVSKQFGRVKKIKDEDDFTKTIKGVKSGQAQFYISFLIFFFVSFWVFDKANGSFHSYYTKYGQYMTGIRSNNVEERITAIEQLIKIKNEKVAKLIKSRLEKGTKKEKIIITWLIGKNNFKDEIVFQVLRKNIFSKDYDLKKTSLLALSRIVENPAVATVKEFERELYKFLGDKKQPPTELILGAAFLRSTQFLNVFLEMFTINETTSVILTYGIVWMKGATPHQSRRIIRKLKKNLINGSNRLKCITTVALAFKYADIDDSILTLLRREFVSKNSNFKCKPEVFSIHPNQENSDTINISKLSIKGYKYSARGGVRYRERILRVIALNRDESMILWLKRMGNNKSLSKYIRRLALQVASRKVEKAKTVDW